MGAIVDSWKMVAGKKSSGKTVKESEKLLMEQCIYMGFLTSCENVYPKHGEKSDDALGIYSKLKSPSQPTGHSYLLAQYRQNDTPCNQQCDWEYRLDLFRLKHQMNPNEDSLHKRV